MHPLWIMNVFCSKNWPYTSVYHKETHTHTHTHCTPSTPSYWQADRFWITRLNDASFSGTQRSSLLQLLSIFTDTGFRTGGTVYYVCDPPWLTFLFLSLSLCVCLSLALPLTLSLSFVTLFALSVAAAGQWCIPERHDTCTVLFTSLASGTNTHINAYTHTRMHARTRARAHKLLNNKKNKPVPWLPPSGQKSIKDTLKRILLLHKVTRIQRIHLWGISSKPQ